MKLAVARVPVQVTRRFVMHDVADADHPDDPIVLIVRPALESNTPYMNSLFKAIDRADASKRLSLETIEESRTQTIDRFSKHIVVDWENAYEDGKPLPCSPEAVKNFLTMLVESPPDRPDLAGRGDLVDELRVFCTNPKNFQEPAIAAVTLGKK